MTEPPYTPTTPRVPPVSARPELLALLTQESTTPGIAVLTSADCRWLLEQLAEHDRLTQQARVLQHNAETITAERDNLRRYARELTTAAAGTHQLSDYIRSRAAGWTPAKRRIVFDDVCGWIGEWETRIRQVAP